MIECCPRCADVTDAQLAALQAPLALGPLTLLPSGYVRALGLFLTVTEERLLGELLRAYPDAVGGTSWIEAHGYSGNYLRVYVGRIRRRLAVAGLGVRIETLRSDRYRLQLTEGVIQ